MTPEVTDYLIKAQDDLEDARTIATVGLANVAARSAYYAAFHAAEAIILARTGQITKTHSGLRATFARIAQADASINASSPTFLGQAYKYKQISDYGVGIRSKVTLTEAREIIAKAVIFVENIVVVLGGR